MDSSFFAPARRPEISTPAHRKVSGTPDDDSIHSLPEVTTLNSSRYMVTATGYSDSDGRLGFWVRSSSPVQRRARASFFNDRKRHLATRSGSSSNISKQYQQQHRHQVRGCKGARGACTVGHRGCRIIMIHLFYDAPHGLRLAGSEHPLPMLVLNGSAKTWLTFVPHDSIQPSNCCGVVEYITIASQSFV